MTVTYMPGGGFGSTMSPYSDIRHGRSVSRSVTNRVLPDLGFMRVTTLPGGAR
jgi:hypothetical protein